LWDRHELDRAFNELPGGNDDVQNPWDE
jgi:hypothetical protein